MTVILDPNVLVSAAVASGVSAELLDRWLTDRPFELVVCPTLIAELRGVLERPKFRRWITADEATAFVALHRSCQADLLVSGDSGLLALAADDVTVITPGELLERLRP